MRKIGTAIFFLMLLMGFTSSTGKLNTHIDQFKWMNGSWKMSTKKGMIIETWATLNDSAMQGISFFINKNADTTELESISLLYSNSKYYYIPAAIGQNDNLPVKFTITSFDEKSFVAENPEHDFPKRIIYQLITVDSIHAIVDGGPSMPDKKSDFYYSRINK